MRTRIDFVTPDIPPSLKVIPEPPEVRVWHSQKDVGLYLIELQTQFDACRGTLVELHNLLDGMEIE